MSDFRTLENYRLVDWEKLTQLPSQNLIWEAWKILKVKADETGYERIPLWDVIAWVTSVNWETWDVTIDIPTAFQTSWRLTGGDLTYTIWQTTFSLSAGTGKIVDWDVKTDVSWNSYTDVAITNITTQPATLIGIDNTWNVVQDPLPLTREGIRNKIYLKLIIHTQGVIEQVQDAYWALDINIAAQVTDLALALWAINLSGNGLWPNGVNMKLNKDAGTLFSHLTNYSNNSKDPSTITSNAQIAANFVTTWRDGVGGYIVSATQNDVPVGRYDDGTGWATQPNGTMASSKYMNYHCYMAITWLVVLQYGNVVYDNISDAIVWADSEQFAKNPQLAWALNLGWISLRANANNLSDSAQAYFRPAPWISGGAGTGAIFNMQAVYDVSGQPQITTNNGSIQYQGWETDTDNVLEIKNTSGTTTATVQADGVPTKGTDLITKTYADANYAWWWGWSVTTLDTLEITGAQYTGIVSLYRVGQSWTLAKFSAYLETAPTGSDFIVVLKINGTTQATATIIAGTNSGTTTSFTSSALTEGDLVTYEITAIGSSVAGSNLTLILNLA